MNYKATVILTVWYWPKIDRQTKRTEFTATTINRKKQYFQQTVLGKLYIHTQNKFGPLQHPIQNNEVKTEHKSKGKM